MATYQSGGVRRATENSVAAARASAQRRQCPRCGRKSALVTVTVQHPWGLRGTYCRWDDCSYDHTYDVEDETREQAQKRWAREDAKYGPHPEAVQAQRPGAKRED